MVKFLQILSDLKLQTIKITSFTSSIDIEMLNRLKFGVLILIPTYIAIYFGDYFYCAYVIFVAIFILIEFLRIIENIKEKNINFYHFYKKYGMIYILISTVCLILLRFTKQGFELTFWLFTVTWSFDTFCYLFGKKYGKTRLTSVSPGKTFEGFILGALSTILVSFFLLKIFKTEHGLNYDRFLFLNIAFIICILYADILESYIKRICEVKDSSSFLGKHGGFMDRFDGIYGGVILIYIISFFSSGRIF